MFVVLDPKGRRLCKDKQWRSFACFGSSQSSVQLYKRRGNAINAGVNNSPLQNELFILFELKNGDVMDANGNLNQQTWDLHSDRWEIFKLKAVTA